jgi:peptide deformylase
MLRKKAKRVRAVDDQVIRFVEDMFDTMHNAHGIGLAATQVGSLQRIIVVDLSEMEETKEAKSLVLINPEIVSAQGKWSMEEGCLSIPDIRAEVERPESIRVCYKDIEFRDQELETDGLLGRVVLHETDHLDGVLFIDHLGSAEQRLLRGRLNKIRRGEVEVNYPVVSEFAELKQ